MEVFVPYNIYSKGYAKLWLLNYPHDFKGNSECTGVLEDPFIKGFPFTPIIPKLFIDNKMTCGYIVTISH